MEKFSFDDFFDGFNQKRRRNCRIQEDSTILKTENAIFVEETVEHYGAKGLPHFHFETALLILSDIRSQPGLYFSIQ